MESDSSPDELKARRGKVHEDGHRLELIYLPPKGDDTGPRYYWRCLDCPLVRIATEQVAA